jgi:hypothetical protein
MKDKKTALYAIAFILIGGLFASPSMQLSGIAFAQDDTNEFESPTTHTDVDTDIENDETQEYDDHKEMGTYEEHREKADEYCSMAEEEREDNLSDDEEMRKHKADLDEYCQLDESDKEQYIRDRMEEYRDKYSDRVDHMKDKMVDKMGDDFVRDFNMRIAAMCDMSEEAKRKAMAKYEFLQEHHERIAEYCHISAEEREKYRMDHQDMMEDFREDMSQMHDKMMDTRTDMRMKMMHDKMRDYDMSDERRDAINDKFRMKHSDLTDVQRDEIRDKLKAKYMDHFKTGMKSDGMSELQKDQILKRHAEMKDYKADLRLKYQDMSEDERIQFQAEFRDKVSDKRFAWISPHKQMKAGVPVDELECREGLNLVLKTSNGKAMCVKSTTAEKLIEKGIAVPAA